MRVQLWAARRRPAILVNDMELLSVDNSADMRPCIREFFPAGDQKLECRDGDDAVRVFIAETKADRFVSKNNLINQSTNQSAIHNRSAL